MTEPWLRGPAPGVNAQLMPAVHALIQSLEEIPTAVDGLTSAQIWMQPGGAASIGFHLQHISGALDRLLTYARGEMLSTDQVAASRREKDPGEPPRDAEEMTHIALAGIKHAIQVISATPSESVFDAREVGRAKLPSNVAGLLFHCAEHTQRHTGQLITTAKIIRGMNLTA